MFYTTFFLFLSLYFLEKCYTMDYTQLNTCVWLSGAAYCGKEQYASMQVGGPATGFVYKDTLYDSKTDLQGYIGVLPSTKSIYVVIRGSSSIMNWLDDFEVRRVDYKTYPECECTVHNGFYRSASSVSNHTISTIKTLQKLYPSYSIVVTGHSYGASCGQLLAMELERNGIKTKLYDFGQPRVGDNKYAAFVNTIIGEYYRTTHNKDTVPHVPPIDGFGYYHSCREIFEDVDGNLTECSETDCEDPKCADQYSLIKTDTDDHLYYLGHRVDCQESII